MVAVDSCHLEGALPRFAPPAVAAARYLLIVRAIVGLVLVLWGLGDARADPVRLRVGTLAVDGSRYMTDILALSKEIEVRTKRQVRLDWITGGQLGDDAAMARAIRDGKLDGGGLSERGLIELVPEMAAWQYPGVFRDYADVDRATAALDPAIRERFDRRGVQFVMWADLGFAHLFSTRPITTLRELIGRATPLLSAPLDGALVQAIANGATAWAMPPLYVIAIGARARAMTELRYRYVVGGLVLGERAWAKLSESQRRIVRDTCREYEPKLRASWRRETERGIAALVEGGLDHHALSGAETAAFFDAAAASRARQPPSPTGELVAEIVASLRR